MYPLAPAKTFHFPLLVMNKSTKHLQYSVLAGLTTIFGLTIGFAGAAGSVPSVAMDFAMLSPNGITEGPFAEAKFDIVGYMSHPCYEIAGTEVQSCDYSYGLTQPLKTYVENGSLLAWLGSAGLLPKATVAAVVAPVVTEEATTTATDVPMEPTVTMTAAPVDETVLNADIDTDEEMFNLRTARSNKLWNICIREKGGRDFAAICYQDNIRLLMRLDIELSEDTVR